MNINNRKDEFDYLRSFAADPASGIDQTTVIRSEARLEQILAQPPEPSVEVSRNPRLRWLSQRSAGRNHRWVAIPLTAAAVIAAGIVWPHNPVTPAPALTAHAALATWQPVPTELNPELLTVADAQCRNNLENQAAGHGANNLELLIAERRGDWGLLSYTGNIGVSADCLLWFPAAYSDRAVVMAGVFDSEGFRSIAAGTSPGNDDGGPERPDTNEIWLGPLTYLDDNGFAVRNLRQLGGYFADGTAFQALIGNIDNATDLVIQVGDTSVRPTISGNWFAAWWPVDRDTALQAEIYQCFKNLQELFQLVPNNQAWCTGAGGSGFGPQAQTITLTSPGGQTATFRPIDHEDRQTVAANLDAARAAARTLRSEENK